MTGWLSSPFPPVSQLKALGPASRTLGENNGQSRRVSELSHNPGWLLKEYQVPAKPGDVARLDSLISLPGRLSRSEQSLVDTATSWPVSRVVSERGTIGVILPLADDRFTSSFQLAGNKKKVRALDFDWLAKPDDSLRAMGLRGQSLVDRLQVCANIAAVAALFEKCGIAYLDWSYANAFWSEHDQAVFVIDVDGCSFGPRPQVESFAWEDPLVPKMQVAGNEVDRYRMALLVARCLTTQRQCEDALTAIGRGIVGPQLAHVIVQAMTAQRLADRPPVAALYQALQLDVQGQKGNLAPGPGQGPMTDDTGVIRWRKVGGAAQQRVGGTELTEPIWQVPAAPAAAVPNTPPRRASTGPVPTAPKVRRTPKKSSKVPGARPQQPATERSPGISGSTKVAIAITVILVAIAVYYVVNGL
jgi:hypothetical protein